MVHGTNRRLRDWMSTRPPIDASRQQNSRNNQEFAVVYGAVRDNYLVRFWSPRRSGVTLTTTHKAGFFDPGGRHS
jgi:hypothetical protein